MSAHPYTYGSGPSTSNYQARSSVNFNRDGSVTARAKYEQWLGVSSPIAIGSPHPYYSGALCAQFQELYEETTELIEGDYIGIWTGYGTIQQVDLVATTQNADIQTHPKFNSTLAGTALMPNNGATWSPPAPTTNGIWVGFSTAGAYTAMAGVASYLDPGMTIRVTGTSQNTSDVTTAVQTLGNIFTNLTAGTISYSYTYNAFMCTNVTYKEVPLGVGNASTFTITLEYLFTQLPGWNSLIYPIT